MAAPASCTRSSRSCRTKRARKATKTGTSETSTETTLIRPFVVETAKKTVPAMSSGAIAVSVGQTERGARTGLRVTSRAAATANGAAATGAPASPSRGRVRGLVEADQRSTERDGGDQPEDGPRGDPAAGLRVVLAAGQYDSDERQSHADALQGARPLSSREAERDGDQRCRRRDRGDDAHPADREAPVERRDPGRAEHARECAPEDERGARRRLPADATRRPIATRPIGVVRRHDRGERQAAAGQPAEEVGDAP